MEKRDAVISGLGAGIIFGVVQSFAMGPAAGVFMGLFFGAGTAFFLHRFANSKAIVEQSGIDEADLLPGERVLLTRPANLVIRPKDFGLDSFAFDDLLWAVGMKDRESLGGAMHLTNYRVLFKSHRYNRLRGTIGIFLPTIEKLENRSVLVFRKLAVSTSAASIEYVVTDVDTVIGRIASARDQLDERAAADLGEKVAAQPDACGEGLESWDALNELNRLINLGKKSTLAARALANPLGVLSSIFKSELLDRTLVDPWQQTLRAAEHRASNPSHRRSA